MKFQKINLYIFIVELVKEVIMLALALQNLGFNNVYNITGSFLGIIIL